MIIRNLTKIIDPSGCATRLLLAIVLLPATAFGPQAFLIHDHLGHDAHFHALTHCDLGMRYHEPEHKHGEHKHEKDQHEDHHHGNQQGSNHQKIDNIFAIVIGLPEAHIVLRGTATGSILIVSNTRSALTKVNAFAAIDENPTRHSNISSFARNLRAGNTIADILLTNHALLI